ncbi:hypothetical protein BKI52_30530 [marine bacterium AO1-C]|nr:hypothetical protein BKI52_30530 [marine bacterium AO1-C]
MEKFLLTVLASLVFITASHAQNSGTGGFAQGVFNYSQQANVPTSGDMNKLMVYDSYKNGNQQTHFFSENWSQGVLYINQMSGLKVYRGYPIRFDLGNQVVFIKLRDNDAIGTPSKMILLDEGKLKSFVLNNPISGEPHYFERCKDFNTATKLPGFFEILYKGKDLRLLKRVETQIVQVMNIGNATEKAIRKDAYYVSFKGKTIKMRRSKKFILNLFKDKRAEVKKFIKDNRLSTRKEASLTSIFAFYNAMVAK